MRIVVSLAILLTLGCSREDDAASVATPSATLEYNLYLAAVENDLELARVTIQEGVNVNAGQVWSKAGVTNVTPLDQAVNRGHIEMTNLLLDNGADVNVQTLPSRSTPLHAAAYQGYFPLVVLLVERGADINASSSNSGRPIGTAVDRLRFAGNNAAERARIVHYLRTRPGAKLDSTQDWTALQWAVLENDVEEVKRLLQAGDDVSATEPQNVPPLLLACEASADAVAEVLLDRRADVNVKNRSFLSTLLHIAALRDNLAIVQLLVKRGADPYAKDGKGRTSVDLSVHSPSEEVKRFFQSLPDAPTGKPVEEPQGTTEEPVANQRR